MSLLEDFAQAIKEGDLSRIEKLLSNDSIDVNSRLPGHANPPALLFAARLGRKDVVDVLLRFGARIDERNDDGRTACHVAARGEAEVLALLLTHRPNLALRCDSGLTPLEHAFTIPRGESIAMMLIEAGAPLDHIDRRHLCHLAATSTSAIRTLLRRGVVFSELRDYDQRTPLHLAAAGLQPNCDVLDMLVNECGVDVEARNKRGSTCILECRNVDAMRVLITAGANLHAVDTSGRTPLHALVDEMSATCLLAAGADVHARDTYGRTPLMHIASFADRDDDDEGVNEPVLTLVGSVVNVMLAAGADLDAADNKGNTARHHLSDHEFIFNVESARREIAKVRLDFVRYRALQVCIGLQSRGLDALQLCEILLHACGPLAPLIAFHHWWKIATTVKHFTPFK
jgi:ankyrin repeat protein